MRGMSRHVIDASALLAILNQESGAEQWTDAVIDGVMSAVNLSEVIARLADAAMPEEDIRKVIEPLDLEVAPFDSHQAWTAGLLRSATKAAGLSLGDRACLALGRTMKLPVLTADQAWKSLRVGVQVKLLRS
jgi:PIN domain nuclease of toxin-antitoxin system